MSDPEADTPTQLDRIEMATLETLAITLAADYGQSWYRLDAAERAKWRTEAAAIMQSP